MTREEFVRRVMAMVEAGEFDKLDELYYQVTQMSSQKTWTSGGEVTVKWDTP